MSILTKIFIVITLVLVLVACVVFTTQATIAPSYRLAYERETQRSAAARQEAVQAYWAADRAKTKMEAAYAAGAKDKDTLTKQIATLQDQLNEKTAANVKIQNDLADIRFTLNQLEKDYKTVEARRVALEADRQTLLDKNTKLLQETRELQASLKNEMARADRMEKVVRVMREEVASRDERIRELSDKVEELKRLVPATSGVASPVAPRPMDTIGPGFQAKVLAVNNDVASIDAGSRKGVKSGMKLIIFRDDKFVAYLRISEVDINEAVGVVSDRKLDPATGDKVMSQ